MPTTQDYLIDLLAQKDKLVSCVSSCVKCSKDETLNAIVPKLDQYIAGEKTLFNVLTNNGKSFHSFFKDNALITNDSIPPLDTSKATDYRYMFSGCPNLTIFNNPYAFESGKYFDHMFIDCPSLKTVSDMSFPNGLVFSSMFRNCPSLKHIGNLDTSQGSNFQYMLNDCPNLETIESINISRANSNSFTLHSGLTSLREIRFVGIIPGTTFTCRAPNLSDASLMNICNQLDDLASKGMTGTLILGDNFERLTEVHKAVISPKGWEAKKS